MEGGWKWSSRLSRTFLRQGVGTLTKRVVAGGGSATLCTSNRCPCALFETWKRMQARREGGRKWNEQSDVERMIKDGGSAVGGTETEIEREGVALEADRIHDRRVGDEVAGTGVIVLQQETTDLPLVVVNCEDFLL